MAELNGLDEARCGCRIQVVVRDRPERELVFCSMHYAAPDWRKALERIESLSYRREVRNGGLYAQCQRIAGDALT